MLTLADVEARLKGNQGPKGGSGEFAATIETDKGPLFVWKPGSYGTDIELRMGRSRDGQPNHCVDLLEAQCLIMSWNLTLKKG